MNKSEFQAHREKLRQEREEILKAQTRQDVLCCVEEFNDAFAKRDARRMRVVREQFRGFNKVRQLAVYGLLDERYLHQYGEEEPGTDPEKARWLDELLQLTKVWAP
jgi:hypothetical protein